MTYRKKTIHRETKREGTTYSYVIFSRCSTRQQTWGEYEISLIYRYILTQSTDNTKATYSLFVIFAERMFSCQTNYSTQFPLSDR